MLINDRIRHNLLCTCTSQNKNGCKRNLERYRAMQRNDQYL